MSEAVSEWLERLGLGRYADAFAAHAIDEQILPDLSDTDLKELGVTALGHRKTILKAIASLPRAPAEAAGAVADVGRLSEPAAGDSGAGLAAWERHPGERKPVTMLFADVTGSTALTEKLDAEEAHALLYGATQRMCAAVENNRGTVCRFMGDGVMAMFGAPLASEHHAIDACQAALEMQEAILHYASDIKAAHGSDVKIRVGLHSGEVVVLEVGEGDKVEYDASGPTVPIAARMEQAAEPGAVYITGATRSLGEHRIDAQPLTPLRVKGISEPLPVYVLRRVWSAEEALSRRARTPFVGRRAELNQFRSVLNTCLEEGQGQTVYVRGEPGIGKTRLVEEFARLAASNGMACHRGAVLHFGAAEGQDAIRALVRSLLGIEISGDEDKSRTGMEKAIGAGLLDPDQEVYLNDLLELPQPTQLRALYDAMDNATRNQRKRALLSGLVASASLKQPILIVVEDVHWAAPVTLAYLAVLAKAVPDCPALLVITARVESDPLDQTWRSGTEGSPFITIDLGPLRERESIELISEFLDANDPAAGDYLERASGNPFFLEQLLQNAREGSAASLPDSIQSLVLARIDRLAAQSKRALQAASVLGQRFETHALHHLLESEATDYRELETHNLIRRDGETYQFAHALIQEGVYGSLLKRQREELHRKAARWYADTDRILHAEHLANAGDEAAAGAYFEAAQEQAAAYRFQRALDLAERGLARATDLDRHRLTCLKGELLRDLGKVQSSIAVYQEALEGAADDIQRFDAWMGLAAGKRVMTDYPAALDLISKAEQAATAHHLDSKLARLHHLRGNLYFSVGRAEDCRNAHLLALQLAEQSGAAEDEARALGGLGDAEYARGRMKTAHDYYARCIDRSREHGFGRIEVAHLGQLGFTRMYSGDWRGAKAIGLAALDVAKKIGDRRVEMNARGCVCVSIVDLDEYPLLEQHADSQLVAARAINARAWEPIGLCWKALALKAGGRHAEARSCLMQAVSITRDVGRAFNAGRVFGAVAFVMADDDAAREAALEEGESSLRESAVSHNYFWFYRFAMDALLSVGAWDRVERCAAELEEYTRGEPLPWTAFFIARGRALARFGRGQRDDAIMHEIRRLHVEGERAGLKGPLPALEQALATS